MAAEWQKRLIVIKSMHANNSATNWASSRLGLELLTDAS
jgi:hypothetical protein